MRTLTIIAAGLLGLSCSKKDPPVEAKPEPIPSGSMRSAPEPPKKEAPEVIRFSLDKHIKQKVRVFEVGSAAVVCAEPCVFKKGPPNKTWLVDKDGVREDPKLWPGHAWQHLIPHLETEGNGEGIAVSYFGEYPKLRATAYTGSRTGEVLPALVFQKKYWSPADRHLADSSKRPRPPRRYDVALVTAPIDVNPIDKLVYGGGGPTLLAGPKKLHVYKGDSWATRPAPWDNAPRSIRLAGGATLVVAKENVFLVGKDLKVTNVKLGQGEAPKKLAYLTLGTALRVLSRDDGLRVYRPTQAAGLLVHPPENRKEPSKPRALATAVGVDSGADGAAAQDGVSEMPPPVGFSSKCKTPFVLLATPPDLGGSYSMTGQGLKGQHELAHNLTFVEYRRGKIHYFGAQAKDEASARKLMELVKQNIPGMKPQLGCLDAVGHIGDPYTAPPKAMRVVHMHLGSGTRLRLD